ncbi:MAG: hypothetical protein KF878_04760 [Planctomycetes bacterium]|nr:hypothetical protein [Planctomycetota bacterium]
MSEPGPTRRQRAVEEGLRWCHQRGVQIEWLDRDRVLCRVQCVVEPSARMITIIAPSFLDAYMELRAELERQGAS